MNYSKNIDLYNEDCIDVLEELDSECVHAVVTDPPYALDLFDNNWDSFEPEDYQEFCEDWADECLRVLKPGGHLLAFSSARTHHRLITGIEDAGFEIRDCLTWHYSQGFPSGSRVDDTIERYTDQDGSEWQGWRSQLKPATEFISLARKPLSEDALYKQVLDTETGALNIDNCRVESEGDHIKNHPDERGTSHIGFKSGGSSEAKADRYPSNLLLSDGGSAVIEDQQDGASRYFKQIPEPTGPRFKYCPKSSKSERTHDGQVDNLHPTVKPVELMEWLITLVTREGQIVLDPFLGSGTTAIAALETDREFIGIEKEEEYIDIAKARIGTFLDDSS